MKNYLKIFDEQFPALIKYLQKEYPYRNADRQIKQFISETIKEVRQDTIKECSETIFAEYEKALAEKRDDEANGYAHSVAIIKEFINNYLK